MSEEKPIPYWQEEISRLKRDLDAAKMENENLRHRFGKYLEMLQPMLAAAYRWSDGKPGSDFYYTATEKFFEEYWQFIGKYPNFAIPLKTFDLRAYLGIEEPK